MIWPNRANSPANTSSRKLARRIIKRRKGYVIKDGFREVHPYLLLMSQNTEF